MPQPQKILDAPRSPTSEATHNLAWDAATLAQPHEQSDKAARVQSMFDAIAPTYERVNAVASFGQDASWRRLAVTAAKVRPSDVVADICCGTGDMIRTFAASDTPPRLILGVDFAGEMLRHGRYDGVQVPVQLCRADAQRLPIRSASVDVVSCAFGIRNFQELDRGLVEMQRVLRRGGRLVILEFALPENVLLRAGYRFYCETILPRIGTMLSRDRTGAYRYLPSSIRTFEGQRAMSARLASAGFFEIASRSLNFGGVVIYSARR